MVQIGTSVNAGIDERSRKGKVLPVYRGREWNGEKQNEEERERDPSESCVAKYQSGDGVELINITEAVRLRNLRKFVI